MEDRHLPNREQMNELRRRGRVPWSRAATRCIGIGAATGALVWLTGGGAFHDRVTGNMSEPQHLPDAALEALAAVVVATSIAYIAAGLLVSLVQTRLLLSPRLLRPSFDRRYLVVPPRARFGAVGVGCLLALYLIYRYLPDLFALLRRGDLTLWDDLGAVSGGLSRVVIVGAGVSAILSIVLKRLFFRWDNRLVRGEMNSEEVGY